MTVRTIVETVYARKRAVVFFRGVFVTITGAAILFARYGFNEGSNMQEIQTEMVQFLGDTGMFMLILVPILLVVVIDGLVFWTEGRNAKLPTKMAFSLLTAFDRAVSAKTERFHGYRHKSNEDVFLAITQPSKQIKVLMEHLYYVFRSLTGDENIKLVLAKVSDNNLSGDLVNAPQDAIPSISDIELNSGTFLSHVLNQGKSVVITSLAKEKLRQEKNRSSKKKFLFLGEESELIGGIAGFPIRRFKNHKTSIYILSIRSEVYRLDKRFLKQSRLIVEKFERRIQLENELERIRLKKGAQA